MKAEARSNGQTLLQPSLSVHGPPRAAERLFGMFIGKEDQDAVLGDLAERFEKTLCFTRNAAKAKRWYWLNGLLSLPGFVRNRLSRSFHNPEPFVTAVRSIALCYAAVTAFFLILQLPFFVSALVTTCVKIRSFAFSDGLLASGFRFLDNCWPSRDVFYQYWQAFIYPLLVILVGVYFVRISRRWRRVFCAYLIVWASYRLAQFLIVFAILGKIGWFSDPPLPEWLITARILIVLPGFGVLAGANYYAFSLVSVRLRASALLGFLLPAAGVAVLIETALFHIWAPWTFEFGGICFLPIAVSAILASILSQKMYVLRSS